MQERREEIAQSCEQGTAYRTNNEHVLIIIAVPRNRIYNGTKFHEQMTRGSFKAVITFAKKKKKPRNQSAKRRWKTNEAISNETSDEKYV
jgi:hypothetical protein